MRKSTDPQTGWFMAPPFHLGRREAPGSPSHIWWPRVPSPPWCQIPNGHSRMAAIRHAGGWGSALKSRNTEREQWEASPGCSADIDLYHNNLLHHLCSGYFRVVVKDTLDEWLLKRLEIQPNWRQNTAFVLFPALWDGRIFFSCTWTIWTVTRDNYSLKKKIRSNLLK